MFNNATVISGQSVIAYPASTVPFGQMCSKQTRTCTNGVLGGTGDYASCDVGAPASCLLGGQTIVSGSAGIFYQTATVPQGSACQAEQRNCSNGALSGTYTAPSCMVDNPAAVPSLAGPWTQFSLKPGQYLNSSNVTLLYQTDGDLVLYQNIGTASQSVVWNSGSGGRTCGSNCVANYQADGNLVLYQDGAPYWQSGTSVAGATLQILPVYPHLELTIGQSVTWSVWNAFAGLSLPVNASISFNNVILMLQGDGNLVVYQKDNQLPLWSTGTNQPDCSSCHLELQGDGNLVLYNGRTAFWSSGTNHAGDWLVLSDKFPYVKIGSESSLTWPSTWKDAVAAEVGVPFLLHSPYYDQNGISERAAASAWCAFAGRPGGVLAYTTQQLSDRNPFSSYCSVITTDCPYQFSTFAYAATGARTYLASVTCNGPVR